MMAGKMVAAVAAEVIDGGSGGRKEDNGGIRSCPQAAYFYTIIPLILACPSHYEYPLSTSRLLWPPVFPSFIPRNLHHSVSSPPAHATYHNMPLVYPNTDWASEAMMCQTVLSKVA